MADSNHNTPSSNGRYRGEYMGENLGASTGTNEFDPLNDQIDVRQIIGLLLHHKWMVIGMTLIFTMLAAAYAFSVMPIYSSNGTVLITTSGNRYSMAGSDLDALLISNFGVGMGSTMQNELLVLRSRTFIREIAERIHQERYMPDGRMYPMLWWDYPKDSTLVTELHVAARLAGALQFNPIGRDNNGLSIISESPNPYEASRIVDLAITAYADVSTRLNRQQARSALDFLEAEMGKVQQNLSVSEETLRSFMNETGLVQLDQQTNDIISQYSRLEGEKQGIRVKQVSVRSAIDSYRSELERLRPGLAEQITSAVSFKLNRLQYALAERETERALILAQNPNLTADSNEPRLVRIKREIEAIQTEVGTISQELMRNEDSFMGAVSTTDGGIISQINSYRSNLIQLEIENRQTEVQLEIIDARLAEFDRFIDSLPENMIELARAKRNLEINEQLFLTISRQNAEMQLWEQTQSGVARVVDYSSTPVKPIKPRKTLILLIGTFFGFVFSSGFVLMREYMTVEINSIEKLRKKGYPLLAVIPDMGNYIKDNFDGRETVKVKGTTVDTGLVMVLDSISPIAESFRRLQANVIYSQPDNTFKTLIITSSNKSEGKTTLSTNLAVALAESGKTVCIIDCDFRRPRVQNVFGSNLQPGVIEVLFEGRTWQDVMQRTMIPNVSVLTTGKRPPNPAEIIRSHKLHDLIQELKDHYDHVLIDSAPFGIISDAAPLIKLADGVILAVRFNVAKGPELDLTIENLQKVKANVLGVVMTAFDHKKSSGYYYTSYYYKYAYDSYYAYHEKTT
jgi:capsular exopolysaccharide synthesis family protein